MDVQKGLEREDAELRFRNARLPLRNPFSHTRVQVFKPDEGKNPSGMHLWPKVSVANYCVGSGTIT